MANIKSAKKRIKQSIKRSNIQKKKRSILRTKIKALNLSIENKKSEEAKKLFLDLEPVLAKSVNTGLNKKNRVSRTLSRLSNKIKTIK
tara:strand:+ start:847 stop:1110 length:264 start_codon:yes stop_codon:yes gene_type:complete